MQVIRARGPNYSPAVRTALARWIGAVLVAGVVLVAAHAAVAPDASHGVSVGVSPVKPAARASGTVRAPVVAAHPAAPSTVAAPPATAPIVAPPVAGASAPVDVVDAQPISFVTTDSPAVEPAAAPARAIALYGDSLTVAAWDRYLWITANDVQTDGHRFDGTELNDWRDSILSNPNDRLVLALGTNDAYRDGAAQWADVLNTLPASKCIVWPKPYEGSSKVTLFNTQMAAVVAAHSNVHVIDWDSQVKSHPEWVRDDHTHYHDDGSNAYADMLRQAALTCP